MAASSSAFPRSATDRTRATVLLLLISAAAWAGVLAWAHGMDNGPGPMGFGVVKFVAFWVVMMAAMMLPAVAVTDARPARVRGSLVFSAGYLAIWAPVGIAFYLASLGTQRLAERHHEIAIATAVAIFVACAAYQVSAWKARALRACSAVMFAANTTIRVSVSYALRCAAATIGVMLTFLALGFMQVTAMVVISFALVLERHAGRRAICIALGVCALAYGIAVAVHPGLAPGLDAHGGMDGMGPGN